MRLLIFYQSFSFYADTNAGNSVLAVVFHMDFLFVWKICLLTMYVCTITDKSLGILFRFPIAFKEMHCIIIIVLQYYWKFHDKITYVHVGNLSYNNIFHHHIIFLRNTRFNVTRYVVKWWLHPLPDYYSFSNIKLYKVF